MENIEEVNLDEMLESNVINFTVSIYKNDHIVYIGDESSSGSTYDYENASDIFVAIANYIRNNVEELL